MEVEVLFKEKFVDTKKSRSVILPRFVTWLLVAAIVMFMFVLPMFPEAMTVAVLLQFAGVVLALFLYVIRLLEALVRKQEAGLPEITNRPLHLPGEAATPEQMDNLFKRPKK